MLSFYQDTGLRPFQAIKVSSKLSQTDLKFQEKSLGIVFWYTMISTKNILLAKIYQKATQLLSCYISTHLVSYFQLDDEKCKMENEFKKTGCAIYDPVIRKVDDGQPMIQVCLYLDTLLTNLTAVSD